MNTDNEMRSIFPGINMVQEIPNYGTRTYGNANNSNVFLQWVAFPYFSGYSYWWFVYYHYNIVFMDYQSIESSLIFHLKRSTLSLILESQK